MQENIDCTSTFLPMGSKGFYLFQSQCRYVRIGYCAHLDNAMPKPNGNYDLPRCRKDICPYYKTKEEKR